MRTTPQATKKPERAPETGMRVVMTFDEEKFIIRDQENKALMDMPSDYVRSILGLVAIMIDEEVPALLNRTYVNREEPWELIWDVTLKPERIFSGNWSPEDE